MSVHLAHPPLPLLPLRPGQRLVDEPSLGPVHVDVVAEDLGAAVDQPRGAADDGAAADVAAGDLHPRLRHDALERQPRGRVHAEGLLDARVEVREALALGPRHDAQLVVGEGAGARRVVELRPQPPQDGRVAQQVVEDGRERDGRRLGPRERHRHRHGEHQLVAHELGPRVARREELGQQVRRHGVAAAAVLRRLRRARDGEKGLGRVVPYPQTLGHARPREQHDGVRRVHEPPLRELEVDGVLQEQAVQPGNLADLQKTKKPGSKVSVESFPRRNAEQEIERARERERERGRERETEPDWGKKKKKEKKLTGAT